MFKKGLILVCLASFLSVYQLNAQDDFSLGPRVGLNFSNVSNVDESSSLTGLVIGLTTTYSINESSGITVDILASHEGYSFPPENDFRLTYLQIPILFDVFFGELGSAFRPKVYVGVTPGFLLSAKINDDKLDDLDDFNKFNLALTGGLGFNQRVASRIWLNVDLRAYLGLTDISDFGTEKNRISTVQPSIGLAYGLSKLE